MLCWFILLPQELIQFIDQWYSIYRNTKDVVTIGDYVTMTQPSSLQNCLQSRLLSLSLIGQDVVGRPTPKKRSAFFKSEWHSKGHIKAIRNGDSISSWERWGLVWKTGWLLGGFGTAMSHISKHWKKTPNVVSTLVSSQEKNEYVLALHSVK